MTFHIGQRVVCVDDSLPANYGSPLCTKHRVVLNRIYIIRGFDTEHDDGIPGLLLEGLVEPIRKPWKQELGWTIWRFRPVIERKTDISIFTAMLNPSNTKEKV